MKFDTIEMQLIDFIKTNPAFLPLYRKLKSRQNAGKFKISSINRFQPLRTGSDEMRLNLVIPTLRATRVFAGISSALTFLQKLALPGVKCRIIVISNEAYDEHTTFAVPGFVHERNADRSLFFANEGTLIETGRNDLFIYTSWKTAYAFQPLLEWQKKTYRLTGRKAVYLIQDYEPGFFAWSTEYSLAESTYSSDPDSIAAVFNSEELYTYFRRHGYEFAYELFFRPSLNVKLKEILLKYMERSRRPGGDVPPRKKRILIYGRPSEHRNAFEIIRYSLEEWSRTYPGAEEWDIVSLGEGFEDIRLQNNTIRSRGKVSLETYARYMLTSYAGISLMISPHPSYPPLEMSTFGVRTITNQFENKDLAPFNPNIISLRSPSPAKIVESLTKICDEYGSHSADFDPDESYLDENNLENTVDELRTYLMEMMQDA